MLDEDGLTDEPIDDVTPSAIEANNGAVLPDAETEGDAFGGQQAITEQQSHSEQGEVQDNDMYFINSSVTQPQKDNDGQNAYISYLVETESNNPVFQSTKFVVRRRFSDFYFLYQVLLNDFPACAIPPLPDKQRLEYLKGDRFGLDFTMKRASSLSRFLKRLSLHPVLKKAKIYHIFLETHDWNSYKQHLKLKGTAESSSDGVADALINAFKTASVQNPEFVEIKERSDKLDENISRIDRIFNKILKRYTDLEQDYFDFSIQIRKLAELEPDLEVPFIKFSDGLNDLSLGFQNLKTFLDNEYIISLKDLEHYITAIKNLLRLKDQKQIDYEALTDYLDKSVAEKNLILSGGGSNFFTNKFEELRGVNHDLARRDRLNKLENKIENLTKEVANAKDVCEQFEKQTLHDIQYFESIKSVELKSTLGDLADNNIKFYQDLIDKWTKIEEELKK
ncbi:Sorting nexin-4 AltName: Full=Autophagy-related protein 24; AltName: Full=Cytoplasm to vacuole targeting protein 13 [Cyberlindnera jadinii]|uniref:Sorting nexin-4 n=1 Tax=Cyberlindnera jadinii (strain ATCC 18201 / CBS 1600 / BCRC 20928 / JCM 3617 / NBRC 0987 / NRRL Y-1542) TaxID=983966 RepID=A0A0H5CAW4_CYBJN|nr:Sorting nexin-4 AltName: Full=Autophagy-related protein 24; AltName: Full=Cytoplasm to vacuole targeting protein 13 [Cyberlindnera jadinii]